MGREKNTSRGGSKHAVVKGFDHKERKSQMKGRAEVFRDPCLAARGAGSPREETRSHGEASAAGGGEAHVILGTTMWAPAELGSM